MFCCAPVFDRLQSFLPQMAEANEKLKQQMEEAPAGYFDIECVEEAQRVIEMVSVLTSFPFAVLNLIFPAMHVYDVMKSPEFFVMPAGRSAGGAQPV